MEKIIRKANNADIEALKALWIECFPKDIEYSEFFFKNIFRKDCAVVFEEEGELLGMIHSFPRTLMTPLGEISAKYIYGVGTTKEARGRGIAGRLLASEECDCDVLLLIPQNESLFAFYEKYGFSYLAHVSKKEVIPKGKTEIKKATEDDIEYLNEVYERKLQGSLFAKRDTATWRLLLSEYGFFGGGFAVFRGGYCAYYEENGKLHIAEFFSSIATKEEVAGAFGKSATVITKGKEKPLAVLKPVSENGKEILDKFENRYINLMHN